MLSGFINLGSLHDLMVIDDVTFEINNRRGNVVSSCEVIQRIAHDLGNGWVVQTRDASVCVRVTKRPCLSNTSRAN
jgi:hypothetical protein